MCQGIDTWCTGQSLRLSHHEVCIYDCHVRQKLIVSDRPFCTCVCICDDCKRCNLRTCTWWSRNCYHHSFLAHLRECVYSLTDIHEVHSQIFEVALRMLVHQPHDLRCIHCWTTTKCDDHIIKLICDRSCHSAAEQESVSYDKCLRLVIVILQLIQRNRQASFLKVYFLRCSEPQHILSPFSNRLNI